METLEGHMLNGGTVKIECDREYMEYSELAKLRIKQHVDEIQLRDCNKDIFKLRESNVRLRAKLSWVMNRVPEITQELIDWRAEDHLSLVEKAAEDVE